MRRLDQPTQPRPWCQRCGMERDHVTAVTVTRDDGHKLTINACQPCRKALRDKAA